MKQKKVLFAVIPLLLFFEKVYALENRYPVIAGKVINEKSGFLDFISYGFAVCIALGGVIMFAVLIKAGLKMITGAGNGIEAQKEIKRSSIGLFILLCVYLTLNTINSALVDPKSIEQACVDGLDMQTSKTIVEDGEEREKLFNLCIKSSTPDFTTLKEARESTFSSCSVKSVITYSEKGYKGTEKTLFNDTSSKTSGCEYKVSNFDGESVKIIPKQGGIYLYAQEGSNSSESPVFLNTGSKDLSEKNFNGKVKAIDVISLNYGEHPLPVANDPNDAILHKYYGAFVFENPGYRGKCLGIDSNNSTLQGTDKATGTVDLSGESNAKGAGTVASAVVFSKDIHKKPSAESYIYLYAVKDCGKNINEDNKEIEEDDKTVGEKKETITKKDNYSGISLIVNFFTSVKKEIISALNNLPSSKEFFSITLASIKSTFYSENTLANSSNVKPIVYAANGSSLPSSFLWDNMHGANWLTSFKNQGNAGTCWAHAAAGALESQIRLYYNQPDMDINLSEQMLVDCTTGKASSPYVGNQLYISPNPFHASLDCFYTEVNLYTISQRGVADENCNQYVQRDVSTTPGVTVCKQKTCADWAERVWKNSGEKGYSFSGGPYFGDSNCPVKTTGLSADDLKRLLILNGPLDVGIGMTTNGDGHAMVLAGYEDNGSGITTWIFKNSWGASGRGTYGPGIVLDGGYLKATLPMSRLWYGSLPVGPFTPPRNKAYWPSGFDGEIKCTDNDGDGYCYWGSSDAKPPSCDALSCKAEKDCNDGDASGHVFDDNLNCGGGSDSEKRCVDNDGDGYCYWQGVNKPSDCPAKCNVLRDCDDKLKEVNKPDENGKCSNAPTPSGISPVEAIPDPEIDPTFGVGGLYDVCKIKIPEITQGTTIMGLEKLISEECKGLFQKTKDGETYDIVSFKFGGPARVVIKGSNGNCLHWDSAAVEKTGSCVNELRGSDVFDTNLISDIIGTSVKPKTITVFPKDQ